MAIDITLPDGSSRSIDDGATAGDLAAAIGRGLAKAAVVAEVNGEERDFEYETDGRCVRLDYEDVREVKIILR